MIYKRFKASYGTLGNQNIGNYPYLVQWLDVWFIPVCVSSRFYRFTNPGFIGTDLANSGTDLPIIRYAEVLLSYLEAKLENGDAITPPLLDSTINRVRQRSSENMPKVTETNSELLRVILRRERRNELAFEGIRLWDLLRWKTAANVLNGDFYGAPFQGATNLRKKGTTIDLYNRWYVKSKAFRAGTDETWPIPLSEVSINPNLR